MRPWTYKYRPKSPSDIQGQDSTIRILQSFVGNFGSQSKKAAFLYGAPGSGKTCSVYAVADDLDLEVVEVNASDVRNRESIDARLGPSISQQSLFSKGKVILVDEIDGLSGTKDRGGLSALSKLIDKTKFPIVMTAQDPFLPKLSTIRKKSELIQFRTLAYTSVRSVLMKICDAEGVTYDKGAISSLARRAGGDLRGAIIDLQTLTQDSKNLTMKDLDDLSDRSQEESMMQALLKVFKTTDPSIALSAFDEVSEDLDKIFLWLDHNIPVEYERAGDLSRAYRSLSQADIFRGRIRRWQHWRFLVYVYNYLSAGVALAKDDKYKKFVKYVPSNRILKIWQSNQKNAKKKSISEKIADYTHTSRKRIMRDMLPFMLKNKVMAESISKELEFSKDELLWLEKNVERGG